MNSAKKVRSRRQHDTLPRAKFLSVNQQQKSEMKRKGIIKKTPRKLQKKSKKPTINQEKHNTVQKVGQKGK